jgi:tight adherence protein B
MTEQGLAAAVAVLGGVAFSVLLLAFGGTLQRMWHSHVSWLSTQKQRFTPDPGRVELQMGMIYAGVGLALIVLLVVVDNKMIALALWTLTLLLPGYLINSSWAKRLKKIDEQLPATILAMSNSVASGLTLVQAIERLSERVEEPIRTEYRIMANQWRAGADILTAIEETKKRLQLPNFNIFATTIAVNQTMGGNVVNTMDRLAQSLEQIAEMQHEVYTSTAEGRQNLLFLGIAPVPMLLLLLAINYDGAIMLFTEPLGRGLVMVSAGFYMVGYLWARSIINADV